MTAPEIWIGLKDVIFTAVQRQRVAERQSHGRMAPDIRRALKSLEQYQENVSAIKHALHPISIERNAEKKENS